MSVRAVRGGSRTTTSVRRSSAGRRGAGIRRASAGFGRTRALAVLVAILSGLALYGASASSAFAYRRLDLVGADLTSESLVRQELGISDGLNLFRLSTDGMAERLETLPAVAGATIEVVLPDTIRVRLTERQAIVVWQVGDRRFLIDADRVAFAEAAGSTDLPVIVDQRVPINVGLDLESRDEIAHSSGARAVRVGETIDPVDFDAATRLGSLRPADVGSGAASLQVTIDDDHGFSVGTGKDGWTAIFGFYTPTIRKTDLIPGQVRLLRSLLAGREATIATVILADDLQGTFTAKAPK